MKLVNGEIYTTTDILRELFDMSEKLIYNISERERYAYIYNYLIDCCREGKAYTRGKMVINERNFYSFRFKGELYLIPELFLKEEQRLAT